MKLILVKLTSFLVIAPSHELESGRISVEILPISLPDLPIPTRDQKSTIRPEFLKFQNLKISKAFTTINGRAYDFRARYEFASLKNLATERQPGRSSQSAEVLQTHVKPYTLLVK